MPVRGFGEFAGGLLHPLMTPAHVLVLLSLGLLLGQERPLHLVPSIAAFGGIMAIGLGFSRELPVVIPVCIALCASAVVVLGRSLPRDVRPLICAAGALAIGLDSASGLDGLAALKMASGVWVGTILCVVNSAFYISLLPDKFWASTAVRIAGSWILAIGILILAFQLRGPQ